MPVTSKKQYRLMQAVAQGDAKLPGLTKAKAAEMISNQSPDNLPEEAKGEALHRLVNKVKQARTGKRFKIG